MERVRVRRSRERRALAATVLTAGMMVVSAPETTASAGVSVIGDAVSAKDADVYVRALERTGVDISAYSAAPGRQLRTGWRCTTRAGRRSASRVLAHPPGDLRGCHREGLEELSFLAGSGALGDLVVIAVGVHDALDRSVAGPALSARLDAARAIIGARPLRLVTVAARGSAKQSAVRRHNAQLVDWCRSDGNCAVIDWASTKTARRSTAYLSDSVRLTRRANSTRGSFIASRLNPPGAPEPEPTAALAGGVTISPDGEIGVQRDGIGAFRIVCPYSHSAADDPIVKPGRPGAAHMHSFFANYEVDAFSTTERLFEGTSTCAGGTANLSGYWVPSMIGPTGEVHPSELVAYYKSGYGGIAAADVRPLPGGLRIVAGEPSRTAADTRPTWERHVFWSCVRLPEGDFTPSTAEMQSCPAGWNVQMAVQFPQCWNGVDLDSPDHISHMAYPDNGCPSTHPVPIPAITLNIYWPVATSTSGWRLSSDMYEGPAGRSGHADWWNAWDPAVVAVWMRHCVNAGLDCGAANLGDGRRLS